MDGTCELCEREMELTFHHLIPKKNHKNKWFRGYFSLKEMQTRGIMVCKDCHVAIHRQVPNQKELGRHYNTKELLMEHHGIKRFVEWATTKKNKRYK